MSAPPGASGPRPGPAFVVMLGLIAAIAPLGMSVHIQSIPGIASGLATSYAAVQLTVSLFLFTFAAAQLFAGPLSDRLGRRPVLFGGLAVFAAASLVAAHAPSIEVLIAARIGQAIGGCASLVTPRAVIQDRYTGIDAARMMAFVAILQSAAPIVAPAIGGALDTFIGWRGIFAFLGLYGVAIGLAAAFGLAESRPLDGGRIASWRTIFARYGALLSHRRYVAYSAIFACGTTGYFGFLATGPAVLIGDLGLKPWQLSIIMTTVSLQFVVAGWLGSRLVLVFGIDRVLLAGTMVQLAAGAAFWFVAREPAPVPVTAALCIYTFSNGLLFANSLAGATSIDPRVAGSAASFLGSAQFFVGGVIAVTLGALPTANFGYLPQVLVLLALCTFTAAIVALTARK